MPRLSAARITLTPQQEADLRAHKTPRKLAERAEMILRSTRGTEVREIARQLGVAKDSAPLASPRAVRSGGGCGAAGR
jgi:hypothetical protein